MSLPRFNYCAPKSVGEAVALRQKFGDEAMLMAGGLATVILLRERMVAPSVVVSLSGIPELHRVEANGELSIGAMVTHSEVARSAVIRNWAPLLAEACGRVGSPAIRNMGTLGGNLSHGDSASDPAPALLALDAEVIIAGPQRERRVPLHEFFRGTLTTALDGDELLVACIVPPAVAGTRGRFIKYTATTAEAFATVTVAVSITLDGAKTCTRARIGLGSVAPVPLRATAAEEQLHGRKLSAELIVEVAAAAAACTDPSSNGQGSAQYRREMTGVWVRRALEDLAA
ncbi:MAG: xanthine dehydrogenase family protein subunit M [Burkholderiales bacterium]|nr:xanthine dehydrogenase family protein subunit M [Burkholderiales bacterium]